MDHGGRYPVMTLGSAVRPIRPGWLRRRIHDVAGKGAGVRGESNEHENQSLRVSVGKSAGITAEALSPSNSALGERRQGSIPPGFYPGPRCRPVDAALARTVAEHFHCGEPMALFEDAVLPITAPLIILSPGSLQPEPHEPAAPVYRCLCGFTLDAPMDGPEC